MTSVHVNTSADWLAIARLGGPIVDPLILRCGELFLRGAANAPDAHDLLKKNVWALGTFFDRIILDDAVPVFDYPSSFDMGQNFDARTLAQVNAIEEILVDVRIGSTLYESARTAALVELWRLFDEGPGISAGEAASIVGELSASGYAWYPELLDLPVTSDQERRLAAFILGGLIFGTYAQQSGADHLMQPKRSRLFLALSFGERVGRGLEGHLFERFTRLAGRGAQEVPYTPTFFPLLLSKSDGPRTVLRKALELRRSPEVRDYRQWLREALADFDAYGRIGVERENEVRQIAASIERTLASNVLPRIEIKTTVADAAALSVPSVGIDLTAPVKAAWGWIIGSIPGRRYRKLLTRAIVAEHEYPSLERAVETVWSGPGFQ